MHIVLFEPEIHYNAGNVGRTCVALGLKLWFVRPLGFRLDDRHLRRAALDYWEHLDWEAVDNWDDLVARIPEERMKFLTKTAKQDYTQATFDKDDVLVFGSESRGMPASILDRNAERRYRIPMRPEARCLNLSVSVGIAAYEAARQIATANGKR